MQLCLKIYTPEHERMNNGWYLKATSRPVKGTREAKFQSPPPAAQGPIGRRARHRCCSAVWKPGAVRQRVAREPEGAGREEAFTPKLDPGVSNLSLQKEQGLRTSSLCLDHLGATMTGSELDLDRIQDRFLRCTGTASLAWGSHLLEPDMATFSVCISRNPPRHNPSSNSRQPYSPSAPSIAGPQPGTSCRSACGFPRSRQ